MDKYLVTGATGFIGKRLISLLKTTECEIRIISRFVQNNFDTYICDFESESIPELALESVDTVFHLAGFAHDIRDENKVKNLYQKVNVDATIKLAKIAIKSGVKCFVFVSSVKAGDDVIIEKNSTNNKAEPEGIYGKTKRAAELQLLELGKKSEMHVVILRPALVYGPSVKGNLELMLRGVKKGWFPPLPEIGNRRSMIHVDDLVRAILLVVKKDRANGEIFIATDGIAYSSREIYNCMCIVVGKSIPKWSVPKTLFIIASLLSPRIKYKINKLLGDEYYSSAKLEAFGFKAKKSLKDMNETDF
jgi:UDP-glucose 4-epimerase